MKLILISAEEGIEHELETVNSLFKEGLEYFHLRKPKMTALELKSYLDGIDEQFHSKIVLHQHYELIKDYQLLGLHYKSGQWSLFDKNADFQQSASFHSEGELINNSYDFAYRFLSPVFDSISKQNYKSAFRQEELIRLKQKFPKLVPLGGIHKGVVTALKKLEFNFVGVCGTIWNTKNLKNRLRQFKELH